MKTYIIYRKEGAEIKIKADQLTVRDDIVVFVANGARIVGAAKLSEILAVVEEAAE
jgi:hypothetical protein